MHEPFGIALHRGAKDADRLEDVDGRQDDFLQEEAAHLDLLHDIVSTNKDFRAGVTVGPTGQHRRGDVQYYRIDDDHPLGVEQNLVARLPRHNQMQPRPKHDRLASDHGIPADGQQKDGKPFATAAQDGKILEDEAQRIRDDAEAGNHQAPEV